MFYSHQLLARKAPLGQIWMAATMHAKINRRNLEKIDIVRICEEILNPSVPLALRLSGILMGGVVIVYERKVKLLYDDVTRLLVQINEAWRGKAVGDPTILPKGKSQAKHEAVTLKDDVEMDQALRFSDTMTFEHQNYYPMQLGQFEEFTIRDEGQPQPHQVDASHITLQDDFESHQAEINIYDRFERFDIEGEEEEININFTPQDPPHTVDVPESPKQKPASEVPLQANANQHEPDKEQRESTTKSQQVEQDIHDLAQQRRQNKRTRPRATHFLMDERIIIPGHEYQPWLQNTSDIVSRREKKKLPMSLQLKKMTKLMDLPTMALISDMNNDMLEVWKKFSQLQTDRDQPGCESPSHLYENLNHHEHQFEFVAAEDFQNGLEAEQLHSSLDKGRDDIDFPKTGDALSGRKLFGTSAGSSGGQSVKSIPSSASGSRSFQLEQESTAGRSKRTHSSASHSLGGLDPVSEEINLHIRKNSKLPRVLENGSIGSNHMMASPFYPEFVASPTAPELELLEETAPTQTPRPAPPSSIDKTTHSILKHLKEHFSAPCAPQTESLNQLTLGMNRKQAAKLFYQTCVLASHNFIRVDQVEAYGDISISRGNKM